MTGKQFIDWQTSGGADDVMRLVDCPDRADVPWCCIGGIAVNHRAPEQMVVQSVNLVIALDDIDTAMAGVEEAGFSSGRHEWSVNLKGPPAVSIQLSTEDFNHDFPTRLAPADIVRLVEAHPSLWKTLPPDLQQLASAAKSHRCLRSRGEIRESSRRGRRSQRTARTGLDFLYQVI